MQMRKGLLLAIIMGLAAMSGGAQAADLGGSLKDAPLAEPCDECMLEYGRGWMVRARVLGVIPAEDTSNWSIAGVGYPDGRYDVGIGNSIVPELDLTYFFHRNFAVEVIAAVTPHEIKGKNLIAGEDIGDVWLLPPTILLQYHFDINNRIKPYVGVGVNYTVFFNEDAAGTNNGHTYSNLDLDNHFGWALQAGVDICLRNNWYLNIDVKKLWLDTEVSVVRDGALVRADVDVDPWIVGVGLGYRFGGYAPAPLK